MPAKPGDILLDRYRLIKRAEFEPETEWWLAEDTRSDNAECTVRFLAPPAKLRASARTEWKRTHGTEGPVISRMLWPIPKNTVLTPQQAEALIDSLGPQVVRQHQELRGAFSIADLAIDESGAVVIAPSGLERTTSLARLATHQPPEKGTETEDALYGLGVFVFQAVTEKLPFATDSASALKQSQKTPLRIQDLRPNLPKALSARIDDLISPDPKKRLAVIAAGPHDTSPLVLKLPQTPAAPAHPSQDNAPPAPPPRAAVEFGPWVVWTEGQPTTAAVRRMAALAHIPISALQTNLNSNRVPVAHAKNRQQAEAMAQRLEKTGCTVGVSDATNPLMATVSSAFAGIISIPALVFAGWMASTASQGAPLWTGLAGLVGVCAGGLAAWSGLRAMGRTRSRQALKQAHRNLRKAPETVTQRAIRHTRKIVLEADLPDPVRIDLSASIDTLEDSVSDEHGAEIGAEIADVLAEIQTAATTVGAPSAELRRSIEKAKKRAASARAALRS